MDSQSMRWEPETGQEKFQKGRGESGGKRQQELFIIIMLEIITRNVVFLLRESVTLLREPQLGLYCSAWKFIVIL